MSGGWDSKPQRGPAPDLPAFTWRGTYGDEPRRRSRSLPFWQTLGFAASALMAAAIFGAAYGLIIWLAVLLGTEADVWTVNLNLLVAYAFGILVYFFVTVFGAHRRAMFPTDD